MFQDAMYRKKVFPKPTRRDSMPPTKGGPVTKPMPQPIFEKPILRQKPAPQPAPSPEPRYTDAMYRGKPKFDKIKRYLRDK